MEHNPDTPLEERISKTVMGGSLVESVAAAAGAILAIIALAGGLPKLLMGIGTIAVGAALLFKGAALSARFSEMLRQTSEGQLDMAALSSGTSAESVGGAIGIILGLLAILGIVPFLLTAVAIIIYGGVVIFGAAANTRLNQIEVSRQETHPLAQRVAQEAVSAGNAVLLLVGLGAIALGILSLQKFEATTLLLSALLVISGGILLSGSALSARMMSLLRG